MGYELDCSNEYILLALGHEANNATFLEDAYVKKCWSFWPRKCFNTGQLLWFRAAVRARRYCRIGDNHFVNDDRWFDAKEFTYMKLKGQV